MHDTGNNSHIQFTTLYSCLIHSFVHSSKVRVLRLVSAISAARRRGAPQYHSPNKNNNNKKEFEKKNVTKSSKNKRPLHFILISDRRSLPCSPARTTRIARCSPAGSARPRLAPIQAARLSSACLGSTRLRAGNLNATRLRPGLVRHGAIARRRYRRRAGCCPRRRPGWRRAGRGLAGGAGRCTV